MAEEAREWARRLRQRHDLQLVDVETGEINEQACPGCRSREHALSELERKYRGLLAQLGALRADRDAEAREHERWPEAVATFNYWRTLCGHPRAEFTAERFWLLEPYLRRYGADLCRRAIEGAAWDPFTTTRRNGTTQRHDGLELVFRDAGHFEDFCNRAPVTALQREEIDDQRRDGGDAEAGASRDGYRARKAGGEPADDISQARLFGGDSGAGGVA